MAHRPELGYPHYMASGTRSQDRRSKFGIGEKHLVCRIPSLLSREMGRAWLVMKRFEA